MTAKDRNGKTIKVGSKAKWYDPEEEYRDLDRIWNVNEVSEEIIYLSDDFSELEAYPSELEIV